MTRSFKILTLDIVPFKEPEEILEDKLLPAEPGLPLQRKAVLHTVQPHLAGFPLGLPGTTAPPGPGSAGTGATHTHEHTKSSNRHTRVHTKSSHTHVYIEKPQEYIHSNTQTYKRI